MQTSHTHYFLELLAADVAMCFNLVLIGSHCHIALYEQDIVDLVLAPFAIRGNIFWLVVYARQVLEVLNRNLQCLQHQPLHYVKLTYFILLMDSG